ncbi:MAG: trypsin-like peptidase domain-containing protein [candidate division Zixibacteria bacterium]|nr:trypsin-like peptidase domain-containing protein [candidate division Zixibacteria bacterium]
MAGYVSLAVICVLLGIIIASNLDLTTRSEAQTPVNIAMTGAFPVVDRGDGQGESPFVAVVDRVAEAVVNISATTPDRQAPWWIRGGHYYTSSGSGFFFRKDGYILTNNHVINDALKVTVVTASGYEYEAQLVGADPQTDLAVLRIQPKEEITVIPFGDSEEIKVGDWAIAIGNPFPQQGLDRTVTVGVVSAKGRSSLSFGGDTPYYQNYIQTDAAINPGNSGGPLLNLRGECIGVNAAITSPTGSSVGIGFAIPVNLARAIVPDLIATGRASRGYFGVRFNDVTERVAKQYDLEAVRGIVIGEVVPESPAARAGIREGDIVTRFNNQEVANGSQFSVLVSTVRRGSVVPIDVIRDGVLLSFQATVVDRETWLAQAETQPQSEEDRVEVILGMEISSYTAEIARDIRAEFVKGLYVWSVYPGTPADRAGITAGTIVMKVGSAEVTTVDELVARIKDEGSKTRIPLIVQEPNGAIARKIIRR